MLHNICIYTMYSYMVVMAKVRLWAVRADEDDIV